MESNNVIKTRNFKFILSFVFLIALIGATIGVIVSKCDMEMIINEIKNADTKYLVIAGAMIFIYLFFESASTKCILNDLDVKSSIFANFKYSAIDFYFCAITPSATGGQPMVAYYMKKDGIPINTSAIVLLFNTVMFKVVLLFLALLSLIFYSEYIFLEKSWVAVLFFIGFAINIAIIVILLLSIFLPRLLLKIGKGILRLLFKMHIIHNLEKKVATLEYKISEYKVQGQYLKTHPILTAKVFCLNLLQRLAFFSVAYFVYLSLGNNDISYFGLVSIQVIIALSVDSLPFPGGVGISESMMSKIYKLIYLEELIVPAMLITRGLSFYLCLGVTMLVVIINHLIIIFRKKGELKKC